MNQRNAKNGLGIDLKEPQSFFAWIISSIDRDLGGIGDYSKYQNDPVAFGHEVLRETYTDEVKNMMESVRDNVVTVAKSANATGKTHGAARVAVWWFKCFADSQVYTAAAPPESNLKKLLWGEIGSITEKHCELFKTDQKTSLLIQRSAQSFLSGVTIPASGTLAQKEARFAGKHAPNLLFIIDEGDAVPDEVYKGIESCMTGGHARLLIMFNPRAEIGEPYRMERDGRAHVVHLSAFSHPNVIYGNDVVVGAVTRETTVRRINQWCRPIVEGEPIDGECFELPKFLAEQIARDQGGHEYLPLRPGWYKIMDPAFSYMVLGRYPAQASTQLISREWIARARSRWDVYVSQYGEVPPIATSAIMGQDVGEFGSDSNVACFRYGGFVEQFVVWGGVDTVKTSDRAVSEYEARTVSRVNVDATGVGAGVAPQMKRSGCNATPLKVASSPTETTELGEFQILRDHLWWACREWLRTDPGAMLPPDEQLIEELQTPTYEVQNGKIRVMKKLTMRELLKRSPDKGDALCLTFFQPNLLFNLKLKDTAMEMKIVNVEKSADGFIIVKIDETGLKERMPCREIRGAVVPPDALNRQPGYFLLLGIKRDNRKSLIFLTESEEADPKALINTLVGLETKYRFHAIYTGGFSNLIPGVLPDRFFIDLHKSFKERIPWVRLCPDPYADNISVGINLIAQLELEKGFEPSLEDSVLRQHLNNQQIGELPGCEFYGVHALRHILGGLSIHKRLDIQAIESHREAALRKKTFKPLSGITRAAWEEAERIKENLRQQDEYWNDFI